MGVMRNNVDKVLLRDANLTDLDDRAENLHVGEWFLVAQTRVAIFGCIKVFLCLLAGV